MKVFNRIVLALVLVGLMVLGLAAPSMAVTGVTVWSPVGGSVGPAAIDCLLNTGSGSGSVLYAGTNEGVFSWNGSTWSQVDPAGLTDYVNCLTTDGGTLYAGTQDNGVYKLSGGAWSRAALSGTHNRFCCP